METTVNERIKQLLQKKGISANALSKAIGMPQVTVNNYVLGRRKVSFELIEKIAVTYPDVNRAWLLTGEGDMLLAGKPENTNEEEATNDTRPRLPVTVAAGMLAEYIGGIMAHQCEQMPVIRNFPTYDFTMIVKGDSMEPKFEGGDEIACTKVYSIVEWGKVYLIDTKDGAFLKRIYEEGDSLRCVSYNKEYPDFIVPKCEVNGIYRVVGLLRF